jgi:hypothetical protein
LSGGADDNFPRWTIPKRERVDGRENLHISAFNLVRKSPNEPNSVLFVKAGPKFPVSFKRQKWLMPAAIMDFGEKPKDIAKKILNEQITNMDYVVPTYLSMQSYMGAHWDIVFIFESTLDESQGVPIAKEPFTGIAFYDLNALPRQEIAEDHLEVLDDLRNNP